MAPSCCACMKGRPFLAVVLAVVLLTFSLGLGGWWLIGQRGPLQLAHHALSIPRAARFVPAQAPLSLYWFSDGEQPVAYARAVAPARQRRPAGEAIARLRDGAFAAAGLDYHDELAQWLGQGIALVLFDDPASEPASSTAGGLASGGWLLALSSRDDEGARHFLQRFWQTRSLAGTDLQVSSYRGMGLISGRGALVGARAVPLATALVDDDLVLIASGRGVLERALDVSQIPELNQASQPGLQRELDHLGEGAALLLARPQALEQWLGWPLPASPGQRPSQLLASLRPDGRTLVLHGHLQLPAPLALVPAAPGTTPTAQTDIAMAPGLVGPGVDETKEAKATVVVTDVAAAVSSAPIDPALSTPVAAPLKAPAITAPTPLDPASADPTQALPKAGAPMSEQPTSAEPTPSGPTPSAPRPAAVAPPQPAAATAAAAPPLQPADPVQQQQLLDGLRGQLTSLLLLQNSAAQLQLPLLQPLVQPLLASTLAGGSFPGTAAFAGTVHFAAGAGALVTDTGETAPANGETVRANGEQRQAASNQSQGSGQKHPAPGDRRRAAGDQRPVPAKGAAAGPLPLLVARGAEGPLLLASGPNGWQMGTASDQPAPPRLEPALAAAGLIQAPLELGDRSLQVWTRLEARSPRGGQAGSAGETLQAPLAAWRLVNGPLAWWGRNLAVLDQPAGGRGSQQLQAALLALDHAEAPLQWALIEAPTRELLRSWQPWQMLSALAGGGLDGSVRGLALALEPKGRTVHLQARLSFDP